MEELHTVLLTCRGRMTHLGRVEEFDELLPLDWHTPVSNIPRMHLVALNRRLSAVEMIRSSRCFAVNFLPKEFSGRIVEAGRHFVGVGHEDKFLLLGFGREQCEKIDCPKVREAERVLECEVVQELEAGESVLFIGKVLKQD